jgi:hypothetical protein
MKAKIGLGNSAPILKTHVTQAFAMKSADRAMRVSRIAPKRWDAEKTNFATRFEGFSCGSPAFGLWAVAGRR